MTTTRNPPRRRRHRLLVPLGLAVLLIAATLVFHAVDQPDPGDRGFLSPVATDADGGSRLADELRAGGVTVRRESALPEALRAAGSDPATLFVPAPGLVHPDTVADLTDLPPGSRLVLVDPPRPVLEGMRVPLLPAERRWATRVTAPDADGRPCPLTEAARAGAAAADHQRYAAWSGRTPTRCYSGGLAVVPWQTEVVVIGASDPFRNDRIDEWGNRALATGLLGGTRTVVWLDLPGPAPAPTSSDTGGALPSDGDGYHGDGHRADTDRRDQTDADEPDRAGADRRDRPGAPRDNPLWDAFPDWFWALLTQLALAGLLVLIWRARRLGPPVPEPLPVTVRSAETVLGRARLYRRAGARAAAAETLRAATLARLLPRLNLPPDTPPAEVAARVAAVTGADIERVVHLLHGPEPGTDRELRDLAHDLDILTRTTEGDHR